MQHIKFTKAFVSGTWQNDVLIAIDDAGTIISLNVDCDTEKLDNAQVIDGYALPGMPNIHSHAFQRAMAGLAEYITSERDSFWTWRDVMYRFAQNLTPDHVYAIARQLYLEMLQAGYSSVTEFHYLHHATGGARYDDPSEMSLTLMRAAEDVGIGLTLAPVLYMSSGFGGTPLSDGQARFGHEVDEYCDLLSVLHTKLDKTTDQRLAVSFHSLRAVPREAMQTVINHIENMDDEAPIHIHIAEQIKEVEDCFSHTGSRPVEWLLGEHDLSKKWCLVHATHLSDTEITNLAKSGAVAGLCPTTEANLGDGIFPLKPYLEQGGTIAIGSDSHVSISPIEELRLLEYGQRLTQQSRNIVASAKQPHSGAALYQEALKGGALSSGSNTGEIAVGKQTDLIVLDPASDILVATADKQLLDRFIFSGNQSSTRHVMICGEWQVFDGIHAKANAIKSEFHAAMTHLSSLI